MKFGENWYVHAPWAQLVCCTEIPEDKLIKFMKQLMTIMVME